MSDDRTIPCLRLWAACASLAARDASEGDPDAQEWLGSIGGPLLRLVGDHAAAGRGDRSAAWRLYLRFPGANFGGPRRPAARHADENERDERAEPEPRPSSPGGVSLGCVKGGTDVAQVLHCGCQ